MTNIFLLIVVALEALFGWIWSHGALIVGLIFLYIFFKDVEVIKEKLNKIDYALRNRNDSDRG